MRKIRTLTAQTRLPAGITMETLARHKLDASRFRGIRTDVRPRPDLGTPHVGPLLRRILDVDRFRTALHGDLTASVTGYCMGVWRNGRLEVENRWNWARTPDDGKIGWLPDVRMHIASCSKFLTAVGLMNALERRGIGVDTPIHAYLPGYWSLHDSTRRITFRHLLTHTSGFTQTVNGQAVGDGEISSYAMLRQLAQQGVTIRTSGAAQAGDLGRWRYNNANFGMMRILIPVLNRDMDVDDVYKMMNLIFGNERDEVDISDAAWDSMTTQFYRQHMQQRVFGPAGVTRATTNPAEAGDNRIALGYQFPDFPDDGADWGDLGPISGGMGWYISTADMMAVLSRIRRGGSIISSQSLAAMTSGNFGLGSWTVEGQTIHEHNGAWTGGNGKAVRAVFGLAPGGREIVVLVNSNLAPDRNISDVVWTHYRESLVNAPVRWTELRKVVVEMKQEKRVLPRPLPEETLKNPAHLPSPLGGKAAAPRRKPG